MRKRKLYHLLALLDATEWNEISEIIRSPFFNTNPSLVAFWDLWLTRVLWVGEEVNPSPAEFVAGSPIKEQRVDALCRDMMALVRRYLVIKSVDEAPQLNTLVFSQAVLNRDKGLKQAHRFLPQLEKELSRQADSPEKRLARLYFEAMKSRSRILARKADINWLAEFRYLHELLEDFATTKGLEWSCGTVNALQIFRGAADLPAEEFYSAYLSPDKLKTEGQLPQLYQLILTLLLGAAEAETFPRIIAILKDQREDIAPNIRTDIFSYALNFCIRKINQGEEAYLHHAFELYRLLIQSGDLLIEGKISPQQYKNLVSLACRVGKLEWAQEFMGEYAPLLSDGHDGLAWTYNTAILTFYQSDYGKAIGEFQKVIQNSSHDVFYGLDARFYLWKSYFEHRKALRAEEVDDMFRLYDSLRLYVDRSTRISKRHQEQYRNLLRLLKGLMQALDHPDPEKRIRKLQNLRSKLESTDVANLTWFSRKLEEALAMESGQEQVETELN